MIRKYTYIHWVVFFLIGILSAFSLTAQKIVKVGTGEYFTSYLTDEGNVYAASYSSGKYSMLRVPVRNVIDVDGAQYSNIALTDSGAVFIIGVHKNGALYSKRVELDEDGSPFLNNKKVYGWYRAYLTLKENSIWIWGEDLLKINGGVEIPAPRKLSSPKNKVIRKLVVMTMGSPSLLALATDGTVWRYNVKSAIPEQIKLSAPAVNIAGVGAACYVIETKNDLLAWGYLGSYLGINDLSNTPVSIKQKWVAAGCVFPSKELIGNYNTLHIIDQNDNMFGAGENVQGEVGDGKQWPSWRTYAPQPYAWNWQHGQMISPPVQIPGKFKNLCTGNSIAFYHYVQDLGENWYSWGRNKARSLGNGITLNVNDESLFPNALNIPAPAKVSPLTVKWKIKKFTLDSLPLPVANAGINQFISTDFTTVSAKLSTQNDGEIESYRWTQVNGKPAAIHFPEKLETKITGLSDGQYTFKLDIVNSYGRQASDTIFISVK